MTDTSGDARVDAVVSSLDTVVELDLAEQVDAFSDAQARLAAVLDTEDETAGPS